MATATTTQQAHPWRATVRTVLEAVIGLAAAWGLIVEALGLDAGVEWVAVSLAVTAAITRLAALPAVDQLLTQVGLGSGPKNASVSR